MALLLLRMAGGSAAGIEGGVYLGQSAELSLAVWILGIIAIAGGIGLVAGFITPASSVAVTVTTLVIEVDSVQSAAGLVVFDRISALLLIAVAIALGLLGAGAYSLDGYLFGRREIIISHDPSHR